MKRSLILTALALAVVLAMLIGLRPSMDRVGHDRPQVERTLPPLSDQTYLRAAHWFGHDWPVNFWNTDLEAIARDHFEMILDDGFNTVVFLVPWPGFAPDPLSGELDPERVRRLRSLMKLADEMGLKTIVRISYAWDWLDRASGGRLLHLWLDDGHYLGWLEYVESVWQAIEDVPGLQFGFFSWEDLWAVTSLGEADERMRRQAAVDSGFADWLIETHGLAQAGEKLGQDLDGVEDIIIPHRRETAHALFLEFVSQAWINRFFLPAQERFPRLSLEIRIDSDPIFDGDELVGWFDHRPNWNLPGADWVTLYWSPAMGGKNQGETLTPEIGAERLAWWLDEVAEHGGMRQIFIGQFLAEDFTPGYEMNGRIPHEDIPRFLELAGEVLQRRTGGVGLWTWTDYAHDAVANPDFFAGKAGWETSEGVVLRDGMLEMPDGEWIATELARFFYQLPDGTTEARLCIRAQAENDSRLLLIENGQDQPFAELSIGQELERQCISQTLAARHLRLVAEGAINVHQVNSTGFVQPSGIRDLEFKHKPVAQAYRTLNAGLKYRPNLLRERYEDGWMAAELVEIHEVGPDSKMLNLQTYLPDDWPHAPSLTVTVAGELLAEVACVSGGHYTLELPDQVEQQESVSVRIEASAVHQPDGDDRRLGCHLLDLSIRPAGDQPGAGPGWSG